MAKKAKEADKGPKSTTIRWTENELARLTTAAGLLCIDVTAYVRRAVRLVAEKELETERQRRLKDEQ